MANTTRRSAGLFVAALVAAVSPASAESAMRIVVHVKDHAGLERNALVEAQRLVAEIYDAVGISMVWVKDGERAGEEGQSAIRSVRLLLLSPPMAAQKIRLEGIKPGVLAQAVRGAGRAYIFVERLEIMADRYSRDFSTILGLVVAHEIGHVLLPENSHSHQGIMRDNIIRQTHNSRFTESQAGIIRDRLAAGL